MLHYFDVVISIVFKKVPLDKPPQFSMLFKQGNEKQLLSIYNMYLLYSLNMKLECVMIFDKKSVPTHAVST